MNNFIFCSISRIPLRKRYLVFQRHILTAFFQNCVYHSISAAKIAAPPYQIEYEGAVYFFGGPPTFLYLFMRIGSYAQYAKDRVPVFDYRLTTISHKAEKPGLPSVFKACAKVR